MAPTLDVQYTDDAVTTLASGLASGATSMSVTSSSAYPSLSAGQHFYATIRRAATGAKETVKVTAVSGTTWTVARAQGPGESSLTFLAGDAVYLRVGKNLIDDMMAYAILKDGQVEATANLPMGGFRHTGVGNASARDHYPAVGQLQDGSFIHATETGAADAYVVTLSPALTAYSVGQLISFVATNANTGASTLDVNGVGAVAIQRQTVGAPFAALIPGDIVAGQVVRVVYTGSVWQMVSPRDTYRCADYVAVTNLPVAGLVDGGVVQVTDSGIRGTFILVYDEAHGITSTAGVQIRINDDWYVQRVYSGSIKSAWFEEDIFECYAAISEGDSIDLSPDTVYVIDDSTSTLTIAKNNITINGAGVGCVIRNDSTMAADSTNGVNTIRVSGTGFRIRNLEIHGDQQVSSGVLEQSGTGHNLIFDGNGTEFRCDAIVENLVIKNGYNGVTVQNKASHVKLKNIHVVNCEHQYEFLDCHDVQWENLTSERAAFRSSAGWALRNMTTRSGAYNMEGVNASLKGADTSGIYFRFEDGQSGKQDSRNINYDNVYIEGVDVSGGTATDPFGGIYFHAGSENHQIRDVNLSNLHFKECVHAIIYNGASDGHSTDGLAVKNVNISNVTAENCISIFQYGTSGFSARYVPGVNWNINKVSGDGVLRFNLNDSNIINASTTTNTSPTTLGSNSEYKRIRYNTSTRKYMPGETIKVTGTTAAAAGTTNISYPAGFDQNTTIVLSKRIKNTSTGVWTTFDDFSNYSTTYQSSTFDIRHPNTADYNSADYELVLQKL